MHKLSLLEHCDEVAYHASKAMLGLGFSPDSQIVNDVRVAALFHDAGKLDPAEEVLHFVDREFTPEERLRAKAHAVISAEMFEECARLHGLQRASDLVRIKRISSLVLNHHTPWEVKNEDLLLPALVLHVADILQSCIEVRHRPALPVLMAMRQLRDMVLQKEEYRIFGFGIILRVLYVFYRQTLWSNANRSREVDLNFLRFLAEGWDTVTILTFIAQKLRLKRFTRV